MAEKCENCDTRQPLFTTPEGNKLCTECTSEMCSWLLDGGIVDAPDHWAAEMAIVPADMQSPGRLDRGGPDGE